jgi:MFS family permease
MFSLLRQRNYALLWTAAFISRIGDFVFIAALPYFVYATSGSALASGATFVSEMVPSIVLSSIGGVYADRWRRKPALIASDWLRGLILLPLVAVHSTSTLWIVYLTAFVGSAVANFAGPFSNAALPHVVRGRDLPAANAAFSAGGYITILIGSPLGGILLQRTGLPGIVAADAVTFLASGALIALVGVSLEPRLEESRPGADAGSALSRVWNEWLAGLRLVLRERWLSIFFLVTTLMFLANSISLVILVPFVRHTLGGSPQLYA